MRLLIVGDTHGQLDTLHRIALRAWMVCGVDAIIQVGDFGWQAGVLADYAQTWGRFPIPVHAIDGNHEDHVWLQRCVADGTAATWPQQHHLTYHPRGTVSSVGGATIGWLGGALHSDRPQEGGDVFHRTGCEPEACNWIRPRDRDRAIAAWTATPPDLIVTHTCPADIGIGMRGDPRLDDCAVTYGAGWNRGVSDDRGDGMLTEVMQHIPLPPTGRRTLVYGHHHVWHRRHLAHPRLGPIDTCCVGSGDGTDGFLPLGHVAIFDTADRTLTVGDRLSLGSRRHTQETRALLAHVAASSDPVPLRCILLAMGGKHSAMGQFVRREYGDLAYPRDGTSGPAVLSAVDARHILLQALTSIVHAPDDIATFVAVQRAPLRGVEAW